MWITYKNDTMKEIKLNTNQLSLIDIGPDEIFLYFPNETFEVIERKYNDNFDEIVESLRLL